MSEVMEYRDSNNHGEFRNSQEIDAFISRLVAKIDAIDKRRINTCNAEGLPLDNKQKSIDEIIKWEIKSKKLYRLKSILYSYDIKDIDLYNGVSNVERYIQGKD
jgi:hypothetical protein